MWVNSEFDWNNTSISLEEILHLVFGDVGRNILNEKIAIKTFGKVLTDRSLFTMRVNFILSFGNMFTNKKIRSIFLHFFIQTLLCVNSIIRAFEADETTIFQGRILLVFLNCDWKNFTERSKNFPKLGFIGTLWHVRYKEVRKFICYSATIISFFFSLMRENFKLFFM